MYKIRKTIMGLLLLTVTAVQAQRAERVEGSYTYTVGIDDDITLRQARLKCLELAKAAAIKATFGELVTSDVIDSSSETNGEQASSYFWENTVAMAKGVWLGETEPPKWDIRYEDGKLVLSVEVKGRAREIMQSQTDLEWNVMKSNGDEMTPAQDFNSGERLYVKFQSPADGYVAVYLIVGDDDTACLLPYPQNKTGRHRVEGGKEYVFFDREADPASPTYRLKTKREQEDNQLVVIYSPHSFTKCNDRGADKRHPGSLTTHSFQRWLLRCQRDDADMVVSKRWIKIRQQQTNEQ